MGACSSKYIDFTNQIHPAKQSSKQTAHTHYISPITVRSSHKFSLGITAASYMLCNSDFARPPVCPKRHHRSDQIYAARLRLCVRFRAAAHPMHRRSLCQRPSTWSRAVHNSFSVAKHSRCFFYSSSPSIPVSWHVWQASKYMFAHCHFPCPFPVNS